MNHRQGFTIIELMLAMTFVTALLLAIALSVIQMGVIYSKGITLKEVNQAGRTMSDNLRRSIAASDRFDVASALQTNSAGGRLCLGQYSYVWNYAKSFAANNPALGSDDSGLTQYTGPRSGEEVHFVKVPDTAEAYCDKTGSSFVYNDIQPLDEAAAVELLKAGDRALNIHQFTITPVAGSYDSLTEQQLYTLTFTIGTGDVSALGADQTSCLPPSAINANFTFCAVQEFRLVIRAGYGFN